MRCYVFISLGGNLAAPGCREQGSRPHSRLPGSEAITLIPSGLTSRTLTCTELKGHCFV